MGVIIADDKFQSTKGEISSSDGLWGRCYGRGVSENVSSICFTFNGEDASSKMRARTDRLWLAGDRFIAANLEIAWPHQKSI